MKKLSLIMSLFLISCAQYRVIKPTLTPIEDFDKSWINAVNSISDLGIDIESADKSVQRINTKWSSKYHTTFGDYGENGYTECRYVVAFESKKAKTKLQCRIYETFSSEKVRVLDENETYASPQQIKHIKIISKAIYDQK
jgi:hypothetical protein